MTVKVLAALAEKGVILETEFKAVEEANDDASTQVKHFQLRPQIIVTVLTTSDTCQSLNSPTDVELEAQIDDAQQTTRPACTDRPFHGEARTVAHITR